MMADRVAMIEALLTDMGRRGPPVADHGEAERFVDNLLALMPFLSAAPDQPAPVVPTYFTGVLIAELPPDTQAAVEKHVKGVVCAPAT